MLLAWDSFECYIEESISRYIQAPDVCWNKLFKAAWTEKSDEWLSTVGIHKETVAGNLKATPRKNLFAVDSWFFSRATHRGKKKSLSSKNHSQAARWTFQRTGRKAICSTASRADSLVAVNDRCFDRSWKSYVNLFKCISSDVEEAHPTLHLLNSDHGEDSDIEIEWTLFTLCIALVLTNKLWNWKRYRKWQSLKHVPVFKNYNGQLPYYCLQEMNWILNKRRTWIKAALESRKI